MGRTFLGNMIIALHRTDVSAENIMDKVLVHNFGYFGSSSHYWDTLKHEYLSLIPRALDDSLIRHKVASINELYYLITAHNML